MEIADLANARQRTDELLKDWYYWANSCRPRLGYPSVAVYCRKSRTSRQYDEDAGYEELRRLEMQAVDQCVCQLKVAMQMTIKTEMRNREVKSRVWRDRYSENYNSVIDNIIPLMRKRGLLP
jgi:hypothetical protein